MILLDIHMPKKSGIEVLNQIRQTEAGKAIPISIITASEELGAVSDVLDVGGVHTDFLTKTDFSLEQIKAHVQKRLE
jgi:CheY-like chemotaxis protein